MYRLDNLVDTPEKSKSFKAKYGIPPNVSIEHCEVGEQYMKRLTGVVAIPTLGIFCYSLGFVLPNVPITFSK